MPTTPSGLILSGNKEVETAVSLDTLADIIKVELESAQQSFLKVGECLCNASDRIGEQGKKAADLIAWAESNCGIKKAQMYKLMKVYETFGENTDFAGVSMRVLYTLSHQSPDVVTQARVRALKGKFESKDLDELIENNKPEPKELKETKTSGTPAIDGSKKVVKKIDDDKIKQGMTETIKELTDTIKELREQLKVKKAPKKQESSIPFLPQFKSKNMCVRLGLEGDKCGDLKEINKAYRALAKIFTATANLKASEALKDAREELLSKCTK